LVTWNTRPPAGVTGALKFFGKLDDERLATLVARGDESAF
jgi:hypothetical protein